MKFLDLILKRELVISPLLLHIMTEHNIKSKYLKNVIEECKQEDKAILCFYEMIKEQNISKIDRQCIQFARLIIPSFFKKLENITTKEDFYNTSYKPYFDFLSKHPELVKSNLQNIKKSLFDIEKLNNQIHFSKSSIFTLLLWSNIINDISFDDIKDYLEFDGENNNSLKKIDNLVHSIVHSSNPILKNKFYDYLTSHKIHFYFDTVINNTPEIIFDNNFLSQLIVSAKSRNVDINDFFIGQESKSLRQHSSSFIRNNKDAIIEVYNYIFQQHKKINDTHSDMQSSQECIFIDKHINDITQFMNNNPSNLLTCYILEAATLANPDYLRKFSLTAPLFKSLSKNDNLDFKQKTEELLLHKTVKTLDPFLLNYLVSFYKDEIDYNIKIIIAENFLIHRFKDTPFPVYKEIHDYLIHNYKELSGEEFDLNVHILDDIENTINKYNEGASERHRTGRHVDINLLYDNFKERLMFFSDNTVNLIDAANMYALKYDNYLSTISETKAGAYENYKDGVNWVLRNLEQSNLSYVSIDSIKYFFQANFFNFSKENIPQIASIFSAYKNEEFLEDDIIKDKIKMNEGELKGESIELLRSLVQKTILSDSINLEPSQNSDSILRKKRL